VTFNIKNIKANSEYLRILSSNHIICLQEHWLFDFEKSLYNQKLPSHHSHIRTVDEQSPITPLQRPRGYGGPSISWHEDIDDVMSKLPDGGNRLACAEIKANPPICVIAAYAPPKGNEQYNDQYSELLDEITEIVVKFRPTHDIILCGDLNASLHAKNLDSRDKELKKFCENLELQMTKNYPKGITFRHPGGNGHSQIDYILTTKQNLLNNVQIVDEHPLNTSDHVPVVTTISAKIERTPKSTKIRNPCREKPVWNKGDIAAYQAKLENSLHLIPIQSSELAVLNLIRELKSGAKETIPHKASRNPKCKKIWNHTLSTLSRECNDAHKNWVQAGKPQAMSSPHKQIGRAHV
jgi:exonuclease III